MLMKSLRQVFGQKIPLMMIFTATRKAVIGLKLVPFSADLPLRIKVQLLLDAVTAYLPTPAEKEHARPDRLRKLSFS